jgi:anti-sigma factor RsiW
MTPRPQPADARAFEERRRWLVGRIDAETDGEGLFPSPQAAALFAEMIHVFCGGAWLATLVLAQAALDADLAENDRLEGAVLNEVRHGRGYIWLRERRNALLHADGPGPAVTVDSLTREAASLERDARRAVDLVVKGLAGTA